jgi:hypothetical protein
MVSERMPKTGYLQLEGKIGNQSKIPTFNGLSALKIGRISAQSYSLLCFRKVVPGQEQATSERRFSLTESQHAALPEREDISGRTRNSKTKSRRIRSINVALWHRFAVSRFSRYSVDLNFASRRLVSSYFCLLLDFTSHSFMRREFTRPRCVLPFCHREECCPFSATQGPLENGYPSRAYCGAPGESRLVLECGEILFCREAILDLNSEEASSAIIGQK